jgi:radical SAM/Cys-rich protein
MTGVRPSFDEKLIQAGLGELRASGVIETLQVNVGKLCNQACKHCHVDAGPHRTEIMSRETMDHVLDAVRRHRIPNVDITGGAPELNPNFAYLVTEARAAGAHVIVRHNFTVQFEEGVNGLPHFFRENAVEIVASLPYFLAEQTDAQRGRGVFEKSLEGMRRLNGLGYGQEGSGLLLNLVYNPVGAYLPPSQASIEADFKRELRARYGLEFNRLYTITNMPISRFLEMLRRTGNLEKYMDKLVQSFNPATVPGLMCRSMLSVGWDGRLYDCDFNQMLELPIANGAGITIAEADLDSLRNRAILTGQHCFGCTAGAGSSCGGAVVA